MSVNSQMTAVANAIRSKTGGTSPLSLSAMATAINGIPSGTTLDPLTNPAAAADIANGKEAYDDDGVAITGTSKLVFDLIGSYSVPLAEYTDDANFETITTPINLSTTDYAFFVITISCDGQPDGINDWGGKTLAAGGRYISNSAFKRIGSGYQFGANTTSFSELAGTKNNYADNAYGVIVPNNILVATFQRKCHATACPKIMGGTYTVKVYGLTEEM